LEPFAGAWSSDNGMAITIDNDGIVTIVDGATTNTFQFTV